MKAIVRQVRISPKKANLVAALVRNKKAVDAIDILKFTPKKGAEIIRKAIESAVANGEHNFDQAKESLYVKEILVTKGMTYKRSIPISRGRTHPIRKRNAHITVKLESRTDAAAPKKAASPKATTKVVKGEKKEEPKAAKKEEAPKKETKAKKTETKKAEPKKEAAKKETPKKD